MDNVERFEKIINERYQAGLQNSKRAEEDIAIKLCIDDLRYLTDTLESIGGMETGAIISGESSTSLTHTVGLIRNAIAQFYSDHQTALAVVLPFDQIEKLEPLLTRFSNAVNHFEARAVTIINALERFEHLTIGTVN